MRTIDVDKLAAGIAPDSPSGPNLEYDPNFVELEKDIQGKPERQIGAVFEPAEEPDWKNIVRASSTLLGRTKHIRLCVYLARGLVRQSGYVGLNDALELMRRIIEQHWDSLYPMLEAEDDFDPTERVNAITSLVDQDTMLQAVREAPLAASRNFGNFSLKDVAVATGQVPPPKGVESPPDMASLDAAFIDVPVEQLKATGEAVDAAIGHVRQIETFVTEKVGAAQAASLDAIVAVLREAQRVLAPRLSARGISNELPEASASGDEAPAAAAPGVAPVAAVAQAPSGQVRDRRDVIAMIDKLCEYYARDEPSSPVPLLLLRAKKLVPMSFVDIVQDMMPDVMATIEKLRGANSGGPAQGAAPAAAPPAPPAVVRL